MHSRLHRRDKTIKDITCQQRIYVEGTTVILEVAVVVTRTVCGGAGILKYLTGF